MIFNTNWLEVLLREHFGLLCAHCSVTMAWSGDLVGRFSALLLLVGCAVGRGFPTASSLRETPSLADDQENLLHFLKSDRYVSILFSIYSSENQFIYGDFITPCCVKYNSGWTQIYF